MLLAKLNLFLNKGLILNPNLLLGHVLIVIKILKMKIVFQMENIAQ